MLLLLLGSLAARTAHWIATPHRLCEVHGALEHVSASASASETERVPAAPAGPAYGPESRTHEECKLGPCARVELFPVLHDAEGGLELPERGAPCVRLPEVRASAERYRLAPSRSPPA